MIEKKLVGQNPDGSLIYHTLDTVTGETGFLTEGDAGRLLDLNQKAKNKESGNWKGELHHVASIDPVTWQKWWLEFGGNPMAPENRGRLMEKLNSRDYSKFRVKSGRI